MIFASADRYQSLLNNFDVERRVIHSIPEARFLDALSSGRPLHDVTTLRRYVQEDLELLREVRPQLVIGDLRLSLGVSARVAGVPYASIMNAYWSPYANQRFPVPSIPAVRMLGVPVAQTLFRLIAPAAMASHCTPMNTVRSEYGLPAIGRDLRRVYTDADYVLYPDVPELIPTSALPPNHQFIGPVVWSPSIDPPSWWDSIPAGKPSLYVTMGSSGSEKVLSTVLNAIAPEPVTVLAATVGSGIETREANILTARFLPGSEAAARSALVICNGGSPTAQQALMAGTPVLGIAANMDQHLNMSYVAAAGAGEYLRVERATVGNIRSAVRRILNDASYRDAASRLAQVFRRYDPGTILTRLIDDIIGAR
jgi:UDP:flavonoid glycosyltransferase YjiC (YdhE family)